MKGSTNSQQKQNALLLDNSIQIVSEDKIYRSQHRILTNIPSANTQSIPWGYGDVLFVAEDGTQLGILRIYQAGTHREMQIGLFGTSQSDLQWVSLISRNL